MDDDRLADAAESGRSLPATVLAQEAAESGHERAKLAIDKFCYSVAKAALIHMTRIMAEELKVHNIRVNGLDPAVMDTRMQEDIRSFGPAVLGEEIYGHFVAMRERGEMLSPERVARLAVFLATADNVTGENGTESHYRKFGYAG